MFIIPFALVVVFGFESLTEWAYHPCISPGFSFILMQVVLMRDCRDRAVPQREKKPQRQRAGRQLKKIKHNQGYHNIGYHKVPCRT